VKPFANRYPKFGFGDVGNGFPEQRIFPLLVAQVNVDITPGFRFRDHVRVELVIPLSNQVIPASQFGNWTASSSFQSDQDESLCEKLYLDT